MAAAAAAAAAASETWQRDSNPLGGELEAPGNRCMVIDDYHGAIAAYTHALDSGCNLSVESRGRLLTCRSAAHLAVGQHSEAKADAQAAAQLNPRNFLAWFRQGKASFMAEDFPRAITAFESALALTRPSNDDSTAGPAAFSTLVPIRQKAECAKLLGRSQAHQSLKVLQQAEAAQQLQAAQQAAIAAMRVPGSSNPTLSAAPPAVSKSVIAAPLQSSTNAPSARERIAGTSDVARPPKGAEAPKKKRVQYSHSHYQTNKVLYLEISVAGLTANQISHRFNAHEIFVCIERGAPHHTTYTLQLHPHAAIKHTKAKCTIKGDRVLLKIPKAEPAHWDPVFTRLPVHTASDALDSKNCSGTGATTVEDLPQKTALPRPYASKKDWNEIGRKLQESVNE